MADQQAADLEQIKAEIATEATRTVSLFWLAEARKIEEQVPDAKARWEILVTALVRIGRPDS